MVLFAALLTVFSWGLWLIPSQKVRLESQLVKTFYVAAANLVLALAFAFWKGSVLVPFAVFWPPFVGGLIWAVGGWCTFAATSRIGIAKAFGIWAPLNIVVSLVWGAVLFQEFLGTGIASLIFLFASVAVIIAGVLLIVFSKGPGSEAQGKTATGLLAALGSGVLWGSYFIPIKASSVSLWTAAWPMALGIFVGSAVLLAVLSARSARKLEKSSDSLRLLATGLLWGLGNYGSLMLIDQLGASRGFTIAQVSIVVASLVSVYFLKEPPPRTKAATLTLIGCVLVTAGGIVLGNLK
jgi:glucose uptake protein